MTEAVQIRYAGKEDCNTLAKVIETVIQDIPYYNFLARENEIKKYQSHNLQDKIADDKYAIMIATNYNNIIGFCLTRFDDYLIWLEWFGVIQDQRGKGIADLLLKEVTTTISIRLCHKIWCDCRTSNEASIHILARNGYNKIVTIPNHWYKQDFILWEKLVD